MDSIPNIKGIRILKGKPKRVCRSTDRSTEDQPRAGSCQSVDRAVDRSFAMVDRAVDRPCLCTSCTPVDWAVDGLCPPVNRAVDRALSRPILMPFSLPLTSSLCAISSNSSLPTILHLGEDFSNLSRTPMNIWQNRHRISAKSTHDLDLANR